MNERGKHQFKDSSFAFADTANRNLKWSACDRSGYEFVDGSEKLNPLFFFFTSDTTQAEAQHAT